MHRIRLIHWNAAEAEERANELRSAGYDVVYEALDAAVHDYLVVPDSNSWPST